MFERELAATAAAMVAPGKGILAIDESGATIKKRFDTIGVESTVESRRAYRDLLITPAGLSQYISGVILYDETLRQATKDGTPFAAVMKKNGILPGIKAIKELVYVVDKILNAIRLPITSGHQTVRLTSSIGIAVYPQSATNSSELLKRADIAMYSCKRAGKDQYRFFHRAPSPKPTKAATPAPAAMTGFTSLKNL